MLTANLILALFASAGLAATSLSAHPAPARSRANAGLWALLGALILGRAGYVAAAWPYYENHAGEIAWMFQGGFSAPAALLGGMVFAALAAALSRQSSAQVFDYLAPLAASTAAGGWLAAWVFGSAYAGTHEVALLNLPGRDEWGVWQPRLILPAFGAVASFGIFLLVDWLHAGWMRLSGIPQPRNNALKARSFPWPGWSGSLGLLLLALVNFSLSFLRQDPAQMWRGMRYDAWGWLGCAAAAALAWLIFYLKRDKLQNEIKSIAGSDQHPVRLP